MPKTVFVNPSRPRKRRKSTTALAKRAPAPARRRRRNAGVAPFVQNPLILSNPRRRKRKKNPLKLPSLKTGLMKALGQGAGAGVALAGNAFALSHIQNDWGRRAAQVGAAIVGGALIGNQSPNMGSAFAGAMMYPLMQDLLGNVIGIGVAAGTEADIDALAADLEDVMDDMDDDGGEYILSDEDEQVW